MSRAVNNASLQLNSNGHSVKKDTLNQDVIPQKVIRPSPLQIKLEEQLKKSRKSKRTNGVVTSQPNGVARYKSHKSRRHKSDHRPLFSMDSDSDEELTITRYNSKSPNVSVMQNSKELAECEERLLKDGYRLDEMSDEEDLDLIPPRHIDNRCCGVTSFQSCVIS